MRKEKMLEKWDTFDFSTKLNIIYNINSYDGSLDYLDYWENDEEFFERYVNNPYELARAICYGSYNFMDNYVKVNDYGNIDSISEYELEKELDNWKEDIIDTILEDTEDNYCVKDYFRECE